MKVTAQKDLSVAMRNFVLLIFLVGFLRNDPTLHIEGQVNHVSLCGSTRFGHREYATNGCQISPFQTHLRQRRTCELRR